MTINIGISEQHRQTLARHLCKLLASTYALYLKTQNFHWNVTGEHFHSLHLLFEAQYGALAEAVDTIAERVRALGVKAPGGFKVFSDLSEVKDETRDLTATEMLAQLLKDHETVNHLAISLQSVCDEASDEVTADLLIDRMGSHQKTAWMLRSLLHT